MTLAAAWLVGILAPPLAAAAVASLGRRVDRIRAFAVACAALSSVVAAAILFLPELETLAFEWPGGGSAVLGSTWLRTGALSVPLVVLPSVLWLVTIAVTPSARLDRAGLRRTAVATSVATMSFLTDSPVLLAGGWAASSALFLMGLTSPERRRVRRIVGYYHLASTVLLVGGIALVATDPAGGVGSWLVIVAVLIRKGIFPFHAWIPEAFDRGRIGPTVLFSAPQLGTFVAATLVLPHATPTMLRVVAVLSLVTALYGAALALFQPDARRALGYLFVSQSALVLAGLDCTSVDSLTGALVLWISSALAFTGLARAVLALEARRGRLDLTRFHGGFEQMPVLAASFLLFGLACTGFPGTLGFIGQELLIDGAVRSFPTIGFLTIGASALTGLAVVRMYFSLFCGRPSALSHLPLLRREAITFGAIATVLVVAGFAPRGIVASRESASIMLLELRVRPISVQPQ